VNASESRCLGVRTSREAVCDFASGKQRPPVLVAVTREAMQIPLSETLS